MAGRVFPILMVAAGGLLILGGALRVHAVVSANDGSERWIIGVSTLLVGALLAAAGAKGYRAHRGPDLPLMLAAFLVSIIQIVIFSGGLP